MPHKADESFFDAKKEWSKRKDLILSYYLKPYLAKVATLRRRILIVDGFAGAGRFRTGEPGSPLLIANAIRDTVATNQVPISLVCIEQKASLFERLRETLAPFSFATVKNGTFLTHLPGLEADISQSTTFLYLDPYAIAGLEWNALAKVFSLVQRNRSVEVLMNFSAVAFARRARSALSLGDPDPSGEELLGDPVPINLLNIATGGDWWQPIAREEQPFPTLVNRLAQGYCDQLRGYFSEVCRHDIKARWDDTLPKYSLLFASRSAEALKLMNDAAIKSRDILAGQIETGGMLFDSRPTELVPDVSRLPALILQTIGENRSPRGMIKESIIRNNFCVYSESQITQGITDLIKAGLVISGTGKPRINDTVLIWKA